MISLLFITLSVFLLSVSGSSVQGRVVSVVSPEELLDQEHQVSVRWDGKTSKDLHREYGNIFKYGNRNAASHLWSSFLLDRSYQMDAAKLESMFTAFCAVSGSPVRPSDYIRYRLTLDMVSGGAKR